METEAQDHSNPTKVAGKVVAIIGAVSAVLVAAVGAIPELPWETLLHSSPPSEESRWQIAGQLSSAESPGQPLEAEVLLIPTGSPLLTTTDAQGKFLFQGVSPGGYWILVRHAESGLNTRVLVDAKGVAESQSVSLPGGVASMGIDLEPQPN